MLYVNGSFISKALTGVQRYGYEMCMAMRRAGYGFQIVAPTKITLEEYEPLNDHVRVVSPSTCGRLIKWDQFDLVRSIPFKAILWNPSNLAVFSRVVQITTIHDLSVYQHSAWFHWKFSILMKSMMPYTISKSSRILTVSETIKKEIMDRFEVDEKKIAVTHNAASSNLGMPSFRPVHTKDVIAIGTLEPRKNLKRVLEAWCQLSDQVKGDSILVVVGQKLAPFADVRHDLRRFQNRTDIRFVGRIEDGELRNILERSRFLIYMSLYEGFGLPIIEALSLNKMCLISDIPIFHELFESGCHFVDPLDVHAIKSKMEELMKLVTIDANWANAYALKYSWDNSARILMRVAEELL